MFQRAANVFAFYKSTLLINLACSSAVFLISGKDGFIFTFLTFGVLIAYCYKQFNRKNEYVFYYNNRISITELWTSVFALNFVTLAFIVGIYNLLNLLF